MNIYPAFFIAILLSLQLYSCSDTKTDTNQPDNSSTETTTETVVDKVIDKVADASGKITASVVDKACDCQSKGKLEDGSMDIPAIIDCMGGKNKIEFVQDLLGSEATEKERSDAEKALTEMMNIKCPM